MAETILTKVENPESRAINVDIKVNDRDEVLKKADNKLLFLLKYISSFIHNVS